MLRSREARPTLGVARSRARDNSLSRPRPLADTPRSRMKSLLSLPVLLAAALFSVVVSLPFLPFAAPVSSLFHFEVTVTSNTPGDAQLFYDLGRGIGEVDSSRAYLESKPGPQLLRFPLPPGTYRGLRLDPLDRTGELTLSDPLIRSDDGRILHRLSLADFSADNQIAAFTVAGETLRLATTPGATDPNLGIRLPTPFELTITPGQNIRAALTHAGPIFVVVLAVLFALRGARPRLSALWLWLAARPARAVALVALLAVIVSSYPVLFFGKSIVSPNNGTVLLYENFPTLPGYKDRAVSQVSGADVGAIMWQHVPLSMLQHDALLRDGELPLWNRYNSAGTVLLGQGQSMFGDPLHLLVILANGATWAWDLKYLIAKWLLAVALGLCVLRLTKHLPSALLVVFAADFVGFFPFRVNHPAYFSFCYAPWALYCWLRIATAPRWTDAARWTAGLLLANWTLMNSGTAKEAYMLLLTLNFAGGCTLLLAPLSPVERLGRLGIAAWAGIIFVCIGAPIWITFLDALKEAYTSYNAATAYQVQPSLALGFFDEVLLRPFWVNETVYNPSANFLFLTGLLAFFIYLRPATTHRSILGLALAGLVPLALVFGLVPPLWIAKIPFLGNVAHIDNSFGVGLIQIVIVLAGVGFSLAVTRLVRPEGRGDLAIACLLLFALVFPYVAFRQTVQRSTYSYLHWTETLPYSPFVWGSLVALLLAAVGFMVVSRRLLVRGPSVAALLFATTCLTVMLWRHGWHAGVGFEGRVVAPAVRADFNARSPAIDALRKDQKGEPFRAIGFRGNLFPGWNDAYRIEGINGPDALINLYYRELIESAGFVRIWDWRIYQEFATLAPLRPFYDLLNVRHYVDRLSDRPALGAQLSPVHHGDLDIYRSETAWPRAFFTDRLATYVTAKDFVNLVSTGDGRPFAAMQANDPALRSEIPSDLAARTIKPAGNYRITGNTTAFDIEAPAPGIVVLTEAWLAHDFRVMLDGKRVSYLRTNHAFKGVVIPTAGKHHLEFTYRPRRFTQSLNLAAIGLILLGVSTWWVRRTEKRAGQAPTAPASV